MGKSNYEEATPMASKGKSSKDGKGNVTDNNTTIINNNEEVVTMDPKEQDLLDAINPAATEALVAPEVPVVEAPVDEDELLFEKLVEPKGPSSRSTDENSAFHQFKDFMNRMLAVAERKQRYTIRVGQLIQGAVDAGIFNKVSIEQRYRRGYNYFIQQQKALPKGWSVAKADGKNVLKFTQK
jgi:hypothetical protein